MNLSDQRALTIAPHATGWIDVSRVACGYGMPGRVELAPSVWLCCVYFAAQDQDRIDPVKEALRLDTLLRNAATAWARHAQQSGSRPGQCHFSFKTGMSPDQSAGSPVSFNLSVTVEADDQADWATRIEMDK